MNLPPGDLTEQQLIELVQNDAALRPEQRIDQRFLDEINRYGRIVSTEEFLEQAKENMT